MTSISNMFGVFNNNSALSTENYDALLINLADNTSVTNVSLGAAGIQYSSVEARVAAYSGLVAKDILRGSRDWTIIDGDTTQLRESINYVLRGSRDWTIIDGGDATPLSPINL